MSIAEIFPKAQYALICPETLIEVPLYLFIYISYLHHRQTPSFSYGAIMQALKAGTYDPEKKYVVAEEVCEEYKQRYINTEKIEEGLDL